MKIKPQENAPVVALQQSTNDSAILAARDLRRTLVAEVNRLSLRTIVSFARDQFTGKSPDQAVEALAQETFALLQVLGDRDRSEAAAMAAQHERQRPIVEAASRRALAVQGRIENIASILERGESNQKSTGKRSQLFGLGLSSEEVDRIAGAPFDGSELRAEQAELRIEAEAIDNFIRSRDESHLPEGFLEKVDLYRATNGVDPYPRST